MSQGGPDQCSQSTPCVGESAQDLAQQPGTHSLGEGLSGGPQSLVLLPRLLG